MSGHSKWHNIQGRKNAQDAKRGKIFQKISRDLYTAAKTGGADPDGNPSLRLVMDKAKAANMPKDNIQRALDKATGANGANYEEVVYEGYGPAGIAVLVESLTDNRNRTAASVRSAFTHHGGSLGTSGSVAFMFDRKGFMVVPQNEDAPLDEDTVFEAAIEAGAEDMQATEDGFEIITAPSDFETVRDALVKQGYELTQDEVTMLPQNTVEVPEDKMSQFAGLIEELEDNDDVSAVYHSAD
ncbi:YebC/PmpR family DNA-binding regulatory protein [Weissella beninensis]|uniref:Probable transcriptional regulatory protein KAK10_07740 n=1 Tax=Periweissella beninensis TaxID=504936 RepID=A0ABT0VKX1_9LACO|nr:YebC/PmpR family DNA-binding transcriptional regulator [Periweissella beninensis]MBM7544296.1 YebC/PmpR family DNA-binding regulatory protein [Periweissella beninensis]MCM2437798.1 YebC/PmpR family DNA-binding transcriptional regulator [Periweissella beninensis]